MNDASIAKLRVDRRLHHRRGWIDEAELQRELDALPDLADKIATSDDEPEPPAASAPASSAAAGTPASDPSVRPEGGGV